MMKMMKMTKLESELDKSIGRKVDNSPMFYDIYGCILSAYKEHIIGEASIEKPIKRNDFGAFYNAIGGFFGLNEKERKLLIRKSTEESVLDFTKKILAKDESARLFLDDLLITEHNLNYSKRVEPEVYMKGKA
jgi:hypothetical protein